MVFCKFKFSPTRIIIFSTPAKILISRISILRFSKTIKFLKLINTTLLLKLSFKFKDDEQQSINNAKLISIGLKFTAIKHENSP